MGATSVVALIVVGAMGLGMSIAWADSVAMLIQTFSSGEWAPPSAEPSGAAWIDSPGYLFVVDTNVNNANANGWRVNVDTGVATNRSTGVTEPTGIDYDPVTNTLFISDDDGFLFVFTDFDTPGEEMIEIDVSDDSTDTEDPAYNRDNGRLYWVDGDVNALFELNPVNGTWGDGDDVITERTVTHLNPSSNSDWEGLAWDPDTGNLLVANTLGQEIYEVTFANPVVLHGTIDATDVPGLSKISGMGVAPASFDAGQNSLWLTDRDSHGLYEITFDGTVPPSTTSTSTTIAPTTTDPTTPTTTTSSTTSSTSTSTTTTTTLPGGSTTTTTQPGSTTTTTIPGTTTTTTTPPPPVPQTAESAVVQTNSGFWRLFRGTNQVAGFFFGNPGDYGFMGDWNCDGIDTPGLYRRSDGYVYLRNSNTQGPADIAFFFGNPGDLPLAGDFDGNGCDTVSIYRPAEGRFFIMNHLGVGDAGLGAADFSFFFGNPGDAPFMGDWNGDGIDTPGLRRVSNGFVYLRHSNSAGPGQIEYFYGDAGDVVFTGDWDGDGDDTLGLYRPSNGNMYLRNNNSTGTADHTVAVGTGMQPFGGNF